MTISECSELQVPGPSGDGHRGAAAGLPRHPRRHPRLRAQLGHGRRTRSRPRPAGDRAAGGGERGGVRGDQLLLRRQTPRPGRQLRLRQGAQQQVHGAGQPKEGRVPGVAYIQS